MVYGGNIRHSSDAKRCAQQIVKEFFQDILIGEFEIPSQAEMESYLLENIDHGFDEYQATKKIQRSRPEWGEEQIVGELEKRKRLYEKELHDDLKIASQNAVNEIENLVGSLKDTLKVWKIKNLD